MKSEYLRSGFDFTLAHAIEEAGEFLAAAGKTQRWGRLSVNPELPPNEQEINLAWLLREMDDLRGALARLEKACELENGLASPETETARMVEERFGRKSNGALSCVSRYPPEGRRREARLRSWVARWTRSGQTPNL